MQHISQYFVTRKYSSVLPYEAAVPNIIRNHCKTTPLNMHNMFHAPKGRRCKDTQRTGEALSFGKPHRTGEGISGWKESDEVTLFSNWGQISNMVMKKAQLISTNCVQILKEASTRTKYVMNYIRESRMFDLQCL